MATKNNGSGKPLPGCGDIQPGGSGLLGDDEADTSPAQEQENQTQDDDRTIPARGQPNPTNVNISAKEQSAIVPDDDGHRTPSSRFMGTARVKIPTIEMKRIVCPQCKSDQIRKNGHSPNGKIQYYRCAVCANKQTQQPFTFRVRFID